jgi:DNA recombination-dependent growth factor C
MPTIKQYPREHESEKRRRVTEWLRGDTVNRAFCVSEVARLTAKGELVEVIEQVGYVAVRRMRR